MTNLMNDSFGSYMTGCAEEPDYCTNDDMQCRYCSHWKIFRESEIEYGCCLLELKTKLEEKYGSDYTLEQMLDMLPEVSYRCNGGHCEHWEFA